MSAVIKNLRDGAGWAAFEAGKLVRLQRAELERRQQESQRRAYLEQLGEAVWRLYAQGRVSDPELVSICHQIQTATHQIVELQKTLARLREEQAAGQTKCLDCGHDLGAEDAFCPFCGARAGDSGPQPAASQPAASQPAAPPAPVCAVCGGPVRPGAAFCSHCGRRQH